MEKAAKFASGWPGVELAIRKMLIECYEKHIPSSADVNDESNQALVSMILDSYFNAEMSAQSLRRALDHFASMAGGGGYLNWFHDSEDEEDRTLPFTFAASFPDRTHATAGDSVNASVLITSNLDYAVHVNSAVLLSLAGELAIPSLDLLSAENASEGHEGGIIIQAKTSIIISTTVELPKDTSSIATDDSGNGGEIQGVAGKGSFAKSARPRSAGVTSAGGARLVSEIDGPLGNRVSQGWSLRYLGGKSLRCDGLRLIFYPVQIEKAVGGESVTLIRLTLKKKMPKTPANIKRTPFEEDNYIASAWSRPPHLPFSRGPRSLRVLGPQPELLVEDITGIATGGNALEGTIYRIVLKLTAGVKERCKDIQCRISCFSVLVTPAGTTRRLVPADDVLVEGESSLSMSDPKARTPCLVTSPSSPFATHTSESAFGYTLPEDWALAESGAAFDAPKIPALECAQSSFVQLALFRPPPAICYSLSPAHEQAMNMGDLSVCKTDFYVTISYKKERPPKIPSKRVDMRVASRRRSRPVMSSTAPKIENNEPFDNQHELHTDQVLESEPEGPRYEEVTLEYNGSVVWNQPLKVTFETDLYNGGSRSLPVSGGDLKPDGPLHGAVLQLTDGDTVTTRCTFETFDDNSQAATEFFTITAQSTETDDSQANVLQQQPTDQDDQAVVMYSSDDIDPCSVLSIGCKRSVAYTTRVGLKPTSLESRVTTSIGSVIVHWKPSLLPLPDDAMAYFKDLGIHSHGPLRLHTPSELSFAGPLCHIEKAVVQVRPLPLIEIPCMNEPFRIEYKVINISDRQLHLYVQVLDPTLSDWLIFSGTTHGEIFLAPHETVILGYTLVATVTGKAELPQIRLRSARVGASIADATPKEIYVLPARHAVEVRSIAAGAADLG